MTPVWLVGAHLCVSNENTRHVPESLIANQTNTQTCIHAHAPHAWRCAEQTSTHTHVSYHARWEEQSSLDARCSPNFDHISISDWWSSVWFRRSLFIFCATSSLGVNSSQVRKENNICNFFLRRNPSPFCLHPDCTILYLYCENRLTKTKNKL